MSSLNDEIEKAITEAPTWETAFAAAKRLYADAGHPVSDDLIHELLEAYMGGDIINLDAPNPLRLRWSPNSYRRPGQ
jgi:hypothetical protein